MKIEIKSDTITLVLTMERREAMALKALLGTVRGGDIGPAGVPSKIWTALHDAGVGDIDGIVEGSPLMPIDWPAQYKVQP